MSGDPDWVLPEVEASWCVAPVDDDVLVGHDHAQSVTPASVMKVQVALTALRSIDEGHVDGTATVDLDPSTRTRGPVGMSLYADSVRMSVRDLLVPMLTISDNVATDTLIGVVGLDAVNATTASLGLDDTRVTASLQRMLDELAREAGFEDYAALVRHDPAVDGPPSRDEVLRRLATSEALDPRRGTRTTPKDMVRLLRAIWRDEAASREVCARLRSLMGQQLTRNRIASGFSSDYSVAAKSGGLLGIVRNEVGVVTTAAGRSFALAIFTRRSPDNRVDPGRIDAAIGGLARTLVDRLA